MIAADKQELESRLKQVTLQIREKEISVFTDNFAVLSTQSAFLTGLGFGGLTMVPTWDDSKKDIEICFYTLVAVSIGFNILTLCISSWCMIFGPGLAIRGPDGSMSRAVEGMYAERKWALRFFWIGLFFIMLSGISLGWLKYHMKTAMTMTVIFVIFIVLFFVYIKYVTRPRFRFPKDANRKPGEFRVAGYDPETGTYTKPVEYNMGIEVNEHDPVLKIEALRIAGILTDEEATSKIALIQAKSDQATLDGQSRSATLRNRIFMKKKEKNGSLADSSHGLNNSQSSSSQQPGSSGYAMDISGHNTNPMVPVDPEADIFSGMLVRDGKLQRFVLNSKGVLIQSSLAGGKGGKQWKLAGERVVATLEAKPNTFMVSFGKTKLKLGANSEEEMLGWMEALARAAYMAG